MHSTARTKTDGVAIIGAGPAGISAAIQLKRSGIEPFLVEKGRVGGLLANANLIENYPGFPQGIPGVELARLFEAQLEMTGVAVTREEVVQLHYDGVFTIDTSKERRQAARVILASGTTPKMPSALEIPSDVAERILYEVNPITGVQGKRVAIVGAGDAAFDYALNLGRWNQVTIINRGTRRRCLPLLWERARNLPHLTYEENARIAEVGSVNGELLLGCETPEGRRKFAADYVIFAIGRIPELGYLSEPLRHMAPELQDQGLLYFVGDVKNDICRQTSIAVGDGVRAAMRVFAERQGGN